MKRVITVLAVALALVGCGSGDPHQSGAGRPSPGGEGDGAQLAGGLHDGSADGAQVPHHLTEPIAVASFVDPDTLKDTNWMGQQIEESFIYELNRRGGSGWWTPKTTGQHPGDSRRGLLR